MNWQPIETAPKDGTEILLHQDNGYIVRGHSDGLGWDCGCYGFIPYEYVTHWMPLPKPPTQ